VDKTGAKSLPSAGDSNSADPSTTNLTILAPLQLYKMELTASVKRLFEASLEGEESLQPKD
jgi:hypothetical protein